MKGKPLKVILSFLLISLVQQIFFPFRSVRAADEWTDPVMAASELGLAATLGTCGVGIPCPQLASLTMAEKTRKQIIGPLMNAAAVTAVMNVSQYVFDRLAYESAVYLVSGGKGETPLFHTETAPEAWKKMGLDIVADGLTTIAQPLVDTYLMEGFNLCAPANPKVLLSIQFGIKSVYQPPKLQCDWQTVTSNWGGFIQNAVETAEDPTSYVLSTVAKGLRPGQNALSFAVETNMKIHGEALEKKRNLFAEFLAKDGYKDAVDFVTGKVKTPASVVKERFEGKLKAAEEKPVEFSFLANINNPELWSMMLVHSASVFTNTLLSKGFEKLYGDLFPTTTLSVDPFDAESASIAGREEAAERYASLVSAIPISIQTYNALTEFVVCPTPPAVRQLNNCVMDAAFMEAVSFSNETRLMTVEEALKDGKLHGDWPLYRPDDLAHNQDPFCYTYGYCYGNLVKLRKARLVSIGWEFAASSPQNSLSNPVTLQKVVDGFSDCNEDGALDASHPWCHLIDPDWVLMYPQSQCRASVIDDQLISTMTLGRSGECADVQSCVKENEDGSCAGYGYCVREKNEWKFSGDACPESYASCLAFTNAETNARGSWLLDTLDFGSCSETNAGCLWSKRSKSLDEHGTSDPSDDSYEWLPEGETYVTAEEASSIDAYQDRLYLNQEAISCPAAAVGCSEFYPADGLSLNVVRNPSFETDEDKDGLADDWIGNGSSIYTKDTADEGSSGYLLNGGSLVQNAIPLQSGLFYTLSFSAAAKEGSEGKAKASLEVAVVDVNGNSVSLKGYSTDCTVSGSGSNVVSLSVSSLRSDDFSRVDCTFTMPSVSGFSDQLSGVVTLSGSDQVYVDAVQVETGEIATSFHEGYRPSDQQAVYLKVSPSWLDCKGKETDPDACANFAAVCSASEAGCHLFTPENGDPSVPAVVSALDECPKECVGYDTLKQEATDFDPEAFPLYFIPDSAVPCAEVDVGCDAFTNLKTEEIEAYSVIRACALPASVVEDDQAVYFTWEGSDTAGYQLQSYRLLKTNLNQSTLEFTSSKVKEEQADQAPCVAWKLTSETDLSCVDEAETIENTQSCDAYEDLFSNPDCREFYDKDGFIHYRLYADTISLSDACTLVRKDGASGEDCTSSGGYWTSSGECRYFLLPDESRSCALNAAGCRSYTGGAGRNATTAFSDTFEDGSLTEYASIGSATAVLSNESVAVGGHSMRLSFSGSSGSVQTLQAFLDPTASSKTYDEENASTCGDKNGDGKSEDARLSLTTFGCEVDVDGDDVFDGTVEDGDNSCGTLDDQLAEDKTYLLSFWAKGSGSLLASFVTKGGTGNAYDFVVPSDGVCSGSNAVVCDADADCGGSETCIIAGNLDPLALTNGWQLYELGPLDTTTLSDFDDTAVLRFGGNSGATFYLDNVQLKAAQENRTLVKDSWTTPSVCDQTPAGTAAPQYYLGCEAYTDETRTQTPLYQFRQLCSESKVGCSAFFATQNDGTPHERVFNATCSLGADVVTTPTPCVVNAISVCTVPSGSNRCLFSWDAPLSRPLPAQVTFGPETVVVSADQAVYLVANESASCSQGEAGCTELGTPVFSQDQSVVTDFTSASFLNLPDTYGTILCSDEDLFCAAWASTQDGTFYFKDPKDRTCEYRTGVSLGGKTYSGWFQNGTTDFCYGSGTCSEDASVVCTDDAVCVEAGAGSCTVASGTYLRNGNESGLWHNGDAAYAGWAGACPEQADLCTEFSDPLDTAGGERAEGNAYFYLDNEKSSGQKSLTSGTSVSCGGAVSLREGCVLFEDHSNPSLLYASSPSLLVSERADRLFGGVPGSLQTPVSCPDGGRLRLADQTVVDVCTSRCAYAVSSGTSLSDVSLAVGPVKAGIATYYGRACLENRECPSVVTAAGTETSGTCETVDSAYAFQNDTNRILRISRDRTCAEWLACDSLQHAWDETRANWRTVCESVQTCNAYATSSENGFCSSWVEKEPVILNASVYSARDVSWYGLESSGYAIPNQLPIPFYRQVNIHPSTACVQKDGTPILDGETGDLVPCDANNDCSGDGGTCSEVAGDYRLAYVAGSCSGENGAACRVGFCTESGRLCNGTFDCEEGEKCTVGFCETTKPDSFCEISDDCGNGFNECHNGVCVDTKTSKDDTLETCTEDADCTLADLDGDGEADPEYTSCIPGALAKSGVCYNSSCLTGIDGNPLNLDAAEGESCRGYPDALAPFPTQIVKTWTDPSSGSGASTPSLTASDINTTDELDAIPSEYISGFPEVPTCSPVLEGSGAALTDGCVCSYDKAEYGKGAQVRYYPPGTSKDKILPGICIGGSAEGQKCENNAQCQDADGAGTDGTCGTLTGKDRFIGWKGFCIERDTSIQLFGSPNEEDRACLTWLPVDQLKGSTDMYAKSVEAGYPLADTYYCTEVGYYADLYPTGTQFDAETGLPKDNIDFACAATDASGCDWPEYGSCEKNVYCPKGYTAVVGSCDNGSLGNAEKNPTDSYCDSGDQLEDQVVASGKTMFLYEGKGRSDDCPYFCIPDGSRHLEGDDAGKSCLGDLPGFGLTNTNGTVYYKVGDLSAYQDGLSYAQKFRDCIVRGVPLAGQSEFATDWMSGDVFDGFSSGGYGYKILEDSNSPGEHYAFGLAHRSVGSLIGRCTSFSSKYPGIPSSEGIEGTPCQSSQDCPYKDSCTDPNDSGCAFTTCNKERAASGSLQVYLGCYEAAKVASLDGEMDPNKAWTNRLWENPNPDPSDPTTTLSYRTSTATDFSDEKTSYIYRPSSYATPDGRSLFEYFSNGKMAGFEKDSWPLPVEACKRDSTTQGMIGLETAPPGSCSLSMYSSYPLSAQYVQEGSTRSILNAEEAPYSYALAFPYEDISTEDEKKAMVGEIGSQDEFGRSSNKNPRGIKELLNQLFAKVYDVWQFSWNKEGGSYVSMKDEGTYGAVIGLSNGSNLTSTGDAHYDASGDGTPDPPTVVSVGSCYGTQCLEGNEGKFTVNNVDGDILEGTGSLHTVVKFYAWANPNQMPLKNVIVNWGDGDRVNSGPYTGWAWPADSYTGSIAPDNFYKNHRGLKSPGESQCDNTDWGRTSAACETAYFSFEHTYRCSNDLLESLPECRLADDGTKRLLNSPCTGGVVMGGEGECVFQPRVFVKDNWGWCTGYCNSNSEDNTEQCYGMYECSPQYCPSTGTDGNTKSGKCGDGDSGGISNPWVNFDGYILVEK